MFEGLSDLKQAIISSEHTSPIFSLLENIIFGAVPLISILFLQKKKEIRNWILKMCKKKSLLDLS